MILYPAVYPGISLNNQLRIKLNKNSQNIRFPALEKRLNL